MTPSPDHYKSILLFLGTAAIVAPLFRRLKISPIFGFLAAGFCLGPYGLGALVASRAAPVWLSRVTLDNLDEIAPLAEFGVAFLLFMIGLELSFERLLHLRRLVFGFGAMQVFSSAAALGGLALVLHHAPASAIILGLALAMSSTAIVIPVLADRKRLATTSGRTIFSVLLFQDLMVAPLLFLVTILGAHHNRFDVVLLYTVLPACLGIAAVVLIGRLVLRPLFHLVAAAGSSEFFTAACLFVVIGTGVVSAASGLSMGLGTLIAGLLLAETEYRRQIEVTIEPFQGLLLGLFFLSVGAGLNFSLVISTPARTLGLAIGFIAIKAIVIYAAGRLFRFGPIVASETALMLAPGGEFALVVIASAVASHALGSQIGDDALVAVTLSMFAVPVMGMIVSRLPRPKAVADVELAELPALENDGVAAKAIIVGYGRVGQLVGEMLKAHAIDFIAIETSANLVKPLRQQGVEIYWGDAAQTRISRAMRHRQSAGSDRHRRWGASLGGHRRGGAPAQCGHHNCRARAGCEPGTHALRARRDRCGSRDGRGQPAIVRGRACRYGHTDGPCHCFDPCQARRISQGVATRRWYGRARIPRAAAPSMITDRRLEVSVLRCH